MPVSSSSLLGSSLPAMSIRVAPLLVLVQGTRLLQSAMQQMARRDAAAEAQDMSVHQATTKTSLLATMTMMMTTATLLLLVVPMMVMTMTITTTPQMTRFTVTPPLIMMMRMMMMPNSTSPWLI